MADHKHGCCADKACTDATCMELPAGKTCGHCVHELRCCTIFGHTPTDTYCDWFPRRFRERAAPTAPFGIPGQPAATNGVGEVDRG